MSRGRARSLLRKLPIDHPPNPYGGFFVQTIQVTEVRAAAHSSGEILALPAGTFPGETKPSSRSLKQTPADDAEGKQREGKLEVPRITTLALGPFMQPDPDSLFSPWAWAMQCGSAVRSELQHRGH